MGLYNMRPLSGVLLLSLLIFVGCSRSAEVESEDARHQGTEGEQSTADERWIILNSSSEPVDRLAGESFYSHFLRNAERENLRRREMGLAFWAEFPADPRRYVWLLETVLIPPHYALNSSAWAKNAETSLAENGAAIDQDRLDQWESQYQELRAEFWNSEYVSDEQRRLLWYAELLNTLRLIRNASVRGETVDPTGFLAAVVAFLQSYPEPFADNSTLGTEVGAHYFMLESIWEALFESDFAERVDWSASSVQDFAARLDAVGIEPYSGRSGSGSASDGVNSLSRIDTLRQGIEAAGAQWRSALPRDDSFAVKNTNLANIEESPKIPYRQMLSQGRSGWVAHYYYDILERTRYRAIGQSLWAATADIDARWRWLYQTRLETYFGDRLVDDMYRLAEHRGAQSLSRNTDWRESWNARYLGYKEELLADQRATRQIGASLDFADISQDYSTLLAIFDRREKLERLDIVIERIHDYHRQWPDFSDRDFVSRQLVTEPHRYGLSVPELLEFVAPFRKSDSIRLVEIVGIVDQRLEFLNEENSIELTAPLFGGGNFDITDLEGKLVYIDPWTTSCGSCIEAMPELHETYLKYKDHGFEFVSLVYNAKQSEAAVQRIVDRMNLTWPVVVGDDLPGVRLPYLLLNRDGSVYAFHDRQERSLASLLAEALTEEQR